MWQLIKGSKFIGSELEVLNLLSPLARNELQFFDYACDRWLQFNLENTYRFFAPRDIIYLRAEGEAETANFRSTVLISEFLAAHR